MPEETSIRRATPDDKALLTDLIRQSFSDVAARFSLTPENCPAHPSNYTLARIDGDFARGVVYYILAHGRQPAGCVALEIASPEICYLERLAVLPEKRKTGIGKALVDHFLARAKMRGARTVSIGTISDHSELNAWYRKIGFIEGDTKTFPHLPFSVTFMQYDLPPDP